LKSYIKGLKHEFRHYKWSTFRKDLLAGLTVAAVALPLWIAFGVGAGARPQAGIICASVAGVVIGFLSGGSYQISGPTGAMAVILLPIVAHYGLQGIFVAGLISGAILIIAGLCNMGKIVTIIPAPVLTGFTSGIAALIIIGQIHNFFGFSASHAESTFLKLWDYLRGGFSINSWAIAVAAVTITIYWFFPKKVSKFFPASLFTLISVTVLCVICKTPVNTIGDIPRSLFPEERLRFDAFSDTEMLTAVALPAISIALLCMIESLLCGEVGAKMTHQKLNARQELIAQGVGNMVIPFFGGVPATAALTRTSVAIKSGGKTRVVSIVQSAALVIVILLLAPVMAVIPMAVLAGILIVVAIRMNEWHTIKFMFKNKMWEAVALFSLTMIATVLFDLTIAILIGVLFSCVFFIIQVSHTTEAKIAEVDKEKLLKKDNVIFTPSTDGIRIAYLSGPIFFPTVHAIQSKLLHLENVHTIILSMRGVPYVDTSAVMELHHLLDALHEKNCRLIISSVQKPVLARLTKGGAIARIGHDNIFWSTDKALAHLEETKK
jgi:SulP family sulfate permease